METIIETRLVEEIKGYKAYDGTVFGTKEECIKCEKTADAVITQNFKKIIIKTLEECDITENADAFVCAYVGESWYLSLVRINNENDLHIAQMYQQLVFSRAKRKFTSDDIGKDLVIAIGEHFDHCYIWGTIDECVDQYRKSLMKFYSEDETEDKTEKI